MIMMRHTVNDFVCLITDRSLAVNLHGDSHKHRLKSLRFKMEKLSCRSDMKCKVEV